MIQATWLLILTCDLWQIQGEGGRTVGRHIRPFSLPALSTHGLQGSHNLFSLLVSKEFPYCCKRKDSSVTTISYREVLLIPESAQFVLA